MKRARSVRSAKRLAAAAGDENRGQLERIDALLKWWGVPTLDLARCEGQYRNLQQFADDVHGLFRAMSSRERQLCETINQSTYGSIQEIMQVRKPSALLTHQSALTAKLLDGMLSQAHLCADLAKGFVDCNITYARAKANLHYSNPPKIQD